MASIGKARSSVLRARKRRIHDGRISSENAGSVQRALPKFTCPKLSHAINRTRLYALFDALDSQICWLCASPGSGKTTAMASYVANRAQKTAWLRLDASDQDPATFFHYFGLAIASALPRFRFRFPVYHYEYHDNLTGFAQQFFRHLATRVSCNLKIVLDDAQEIDQALLAQTINCAAQELPSNIKLIILSRAQPHADLARLQTSSQLSVIDNDHLQFTRQEAKQLLASLSVQLDEAQFEQLFTETNGWAAGLQLLRASNGVPISHANGEQTIAYSLLFDYFASEVHAHLNPRLRNLLLKTAHLAQVPVAIAVSLTEDPDCQKLLDELCQRCLFTYRIASTPPVYEYHSLFREFVKSQANTTFTKAERKALLQLSGNLLAQHDQVDAAIELLLNAEAWPDACTLILKHVEIFCAQGRQQTLCRWLSKLPEQIRDIDPWLSFWYAETLLVTSETEARKYLDVAYRNFAACGDQLGQLLTCAFILEAMHLGRCTFHDLEHWATQMKSLYQQHPICDRADELSVATGRILASLLLYDFDDALDLACSKVENLLHEDININRRLSSAMILLWYFFAKLQRVKALDLISSAKELLKHPGLTALQKARWLWIEGYYRMAYEGENRKADGLWLAAEKIAAQANLPKIKVTIRLYRAQAALREGEIEVVQKYLDEVNGELSFASAMDRVIYHYTGSRFAAVRGEADEAFNHAQAALNHCERIHYPIRLRNTYLLALASALLMQEKYVEAEAILSDLDSTAGTVRTVNRCLIDLLLGYIAIKTQQSESAERFLRSGLKAAREANFSNLFPTSPAITGTICETAIRFNIESAFAARIAAQRQLLVPEPDWDNWPWPIKIYCLGKFAIHLNDIPFNVSAKSPHKLIDLLQTLLAYGGREILIGDVIDLLYPGESRVGAQQAFDVALHRLRKLLRDDAALLVRKNRISLNPERVWVDAWSLMNSLRRLGSAVPELHPRTIAKKIFSLYFGHFLADSPAELRSLKSGDRLWSKVQEFLLQWGKKLEAEGCFRDALTTYRFVLDRDPLAGTFYESTIVLLIRLKRTEEAMQLYAACAANFRDLLGKETPRQLQELVQNDFKT